MKKTLLSCLIVLCLLACGRKKDVLVVAVKNPAAVARTAEMVELPMNRVADELQLPDTARLVVMDGKGNQLPYQITYDNKLIFPATVAADDQSDYTIQIGVPEEVADYVEGRVYPDRFDDFAWENDLVAFRAYGPALQARGERGFGYDLFCKRGTDKPVLEEHIYGRELNPEYCTLAPKLRLTDPESAHAMALQYSYHVDHGYGMDCYAVGPTLGGGTAALCAGDSLFYPWCYKEVEILDNGPLRFTARLTFTPLTVRGDTNVVETRVITLDKGSHLNRTVVSYEGLTESLGICAGIVLHDTVGAVSAEADKGYIAYEDPTTGPDQGKIFVGCAFPGLVDKAYEKRFASADEKALHGNAEGHVLAVASYRPGDEFTYYWGFGWNRADISDMGAWVEYMEQAAQRVRMPLEVKID